ncbi:MAG: MBL fold metallo-hydrolase [Methanomicrobiaceae archaeon]|nr:MBL fold metallo-hydrolase [Methanomicrobiaceae archaeon]
MFIQQFFIKGIAHSSYLVGGDETCAIVDPARDVERYIEAARDLNLKITHILETHLHADFVSGHVDLAEQTGAKIFAPRAGGCRFDHIPVYEGTRFSLEGMDFSVLETFGHTPDNVTFVVTDRSRGDEPAAAFTGDCLFVGDVGRPDLFPGRAEELASQLFHSLHDKLMLLPDACMVFPAHGAGSLCGKAMGAMRWSTIGYERRHNPALQIRDEEEFIRVMTHDMPPAPDHFSRCSDINRQGPALVRTLPKIVPHKPREFAAKAESSDTIVLSIRNYATFGGMHVPGSWHIDIAGNFSTFAGWALPPDKEILLVTDSPSQAQEAAVMLRRVGLDHTVGYLDGGTHSWVTAGYAVDHVHQLSPDETHEMLKREEVVLVDVRSKDEYAEGHVEGAINIMVMDLRSRYTELDPALPTIVMCRSGHRSSLASSILKQKGFVDVYNAAGGITGYTAAGYR